MNLGAFFAAPFWVQVHALAAIAALALGAAQLAAPKGTLSHRAVGWVWVTLMATTALSSFIFV